METCTFKVNNRENIHFLLTGKWRHLLSLCITIYKIAYNFIHVVVDAIEKKMYAGCDCPA